MKRALMLVVVLLAGCGGGTDGGGGGGGGGGAEIPPGNVVWFGTSYDPTSFAVIGKAAKLQQGTPMVAVAKLFTARGPGAVQVKITSGSIVRAPVPVSGANNGEQSDLFAFDLAGTGLTPNTWIVSFVDPQQRILASGFITIVP